MNERKFTPEEIAKSLRVCATVGNDCEGCIYNLCLDVGHCYLSLRKIAVDMIEDQAKRIRELEAELAKLREENRWIPTSERLPDLDDGTTLLDGEMVAVEVLVMIQDAEKSTCLYFDGEDFFDYTGDELIPYRVTRWMPMPKGSEAEHGR